MVLVGGNIPRKNAFRCCLVSRCIQTKSGFNVFAPPWSHSVDASWDFYDLCREMNHQISFFMPKVLLLVPLDEV